MYIHAVNVRKCRDCFHTRLQYIIQRLFLHSLVIRIINNKINPRLTGYSHHIGFGHLLERHLEADLLLLVFTKALLHYSILALGTFYAILKRTSVGGGAYGRSHENFKLFSSSAS